MSPGTLGRTKTRGSGVLPKQDRVMGERIGGPVALKGHVVGYLQNKIKMIWGSPKNESPPELESTRSSRGNCCSMT